jgi:hypothetical protein
MLAAGVQNDKAATRAFFCQMPDEVNQFDATCAGIDYYENNISHYAGKAHVVMRPPMSFAGFSQSTDPRTLPSRPLTNAEFVQRNILDQEISVGLHSLSGLISEDERRFRKAILYETAADDLKFGLALHAYGDAFAHQDIEFPDKMYDPIIGHFVEAERLQDAEATTHFEEDPEYVRALNSDDKLAQLRLDGIKAQALLVNKNEPDDVANPIPARRKLYLRYVRDLYSIVSGAMGGLTPRCSAEKAVKILSQVTEMEFTFREGDEIRQNRTSARIIDLASETFRIDISRFYTPQRDQELYWKEFAPHTRALSCWSESSPHRSRPTGDLRDEIFQFVMATAREWYMRRLCIPGLPKYRAQPL